MEKYISALENIPYQDWVKLRTAIDRQFDLQKKELERNVQLTIDNEKIEKLIHSQFG